MKRTTFSIAASFCLLAFIGCNDSGTTTTTGDSSSVKAADSGNNAANNSSVDNTNNANLTASEPLGKDDSLFAMKAAIGGLMEVEAGNLAQQNAGNARVKAFAAMMVNDHSKANAELMSFAGSRGISLPTALPADMQKHMDAMKKMTGKAFDKHYMDMMVNDHKKTIDDFEKEANSGANADLKTWAAKTLPTLQMHRDSALAINKSKL